MAWCSMCVSIMLLRTEPAASSRGAWATGAGASAYALRAGAARMFADEDPRAAAAAAAASPRVPGAFAPAFPLRMRSLLLRGGCAGAVRSKPAQCSFCTKVHAASDLCKAERTMAARAADGRRTTDGWALLSTMRGDGSSQKDPKVGQPKGLSEYGWGETAYAQSSASQPQMGKCWVSHAYVPPPCPRSAPLAKHR